MDSDDEEKDLNSLNSYDIKRIRGAFESSQDIPLDYVDRLTNMMEMYSETDRGAALVGACIIDDVLEHLIRAFLRPGNSTKKLFEGMNAPLSNFSSRIAMAHSLGLIANIEHKALEAIRQIRNDFAHQVGINFDHPTITKKLEALRMIPTSQNPKYLNRDVFLTSVNYLEISLRNRLGGTSHVDLHKGAFDAEKIVAAAKNQ